MSEFKFSCPHCDQHILVSDGYEGAQINCPACQKLIVVPPTPGAAKPPAPPAVLGIQRPAAPSASSAAAPTAARTAYRPPPPPAQKSGSRALKTVLVITAVVVALAVLGGGGWFGYSKLKAGREAKNGNPAAQVTAPTSTATIEALSILSKVHSAYTNLTSVRADGTVTLFLNLSNITIADVNPNSPAAAKNGNRHPQGMPRVVTNTTELSIKRAQPDLYYLAGEAVSKIDRQTVSNTFAFWSSDKGRFMFTDSHQKMMPPSYRQLADGSLTNKDTEQFKKMQELFADPENLTKIIKDLGQTGDESVEGQDCYTLTAKALGQKVKIWVDKTSYLIPQWQITLGGAISDTDIDDAFSLFAAGFTNMPSAQLDMIKAQVKKSAPVVAKIRGTITSTSRNIEANPPLTAADFNYDVPPGVRLTPMFTPQRAPRTGASMQVSQRNACINNLRQIDAAKNEWALEKGKKSGALVTEDDIKPYIKLEADGNLPKCPAGGKYTIGHLGENPTCSIPGHELP